MASCTNYQNYCIKPYWKYKPTSLVRGSYFKNNWEERCEEIYFPMRHVADLPWKTINLEELPIHFSLHPFQSCTGEIISLSHVTLEIEFIEIDESDPNYYILRPNKKTGKFGYDKYDGSPVGHTFVACDTGIRSTESLYRFIEAGESIFPGNYIWWSVEIKEPPLAYYHPYHVPYLPSLPFTEECESPYGNVEINGSIKHVLEAYQSSFPRDPSNRKLPRIELRNGGTLRYKFEVCHVIIVCAAYIRQRPFLPLDQYPLWDEGRNNIKYNEYTGAIVWVNPIQVTYKNTVKCSGGQIYPWDNFVFAFYFPDDTQVMKCPKEIFDHYEVYHDEDMCLKKKPHLYNDRRRLVCPNNI